MIFYHTNLKKRMMNYNLQTKFLLIVTIVHKRYFFKYFDFYIIYRSTTNIFNTGSSYVWMKWWSSRENNFFSFYRIFRIKKKYISRKKLFNISKNSSGIFHKKKVLEISSTNFFLSLILMKCFLYVSENFKGKKIMGKLKILP